MSDFSLRTDCLAAAAQYVSTEDTRFYLNGVFVTPHEVDQAGRGVLMVATDGNCMAVIYDAYGHAPRSAILSFNASDKALKKPVREEGARRLMLNDNAAALSTGTPAPVQAYCPDEGTPDKRISPVGYVTVSEIDGSFPDFWRVIPTASADGPSAPYAWNASHFARLTKAARLLGQKQPMAAFQQASASDPALITLASCPHAVFIHMPLRAAIYTQPAWLYPPKDEESTT